MSLRYLIALLFVGSTAVNAASISVSPSAQQTLLGDAFSLEIEYDFSMETTAGGGLDVFYDPAILRFDSFSFDPNLPDDAALRFQPTNPIGGEVRGIGFGSFFGISDQGRVGSLIFTAISTGTSAITVAENVSGPNSPGPFVTEFGQPLTNLTLTGANVGVSAPVPLPGALVLFASAFGLAYWRRRSPA